MTAWQWHNTRWASWAVDSPYKGPWGAPVTGGLPLLRASNAEITATCMSSYYLLLADCVRLQLGVFVTSLVIMLIAAFMACFACYSASHKRMLYVGVACLLAGMIWLILFVIYPKLVLPLLLLSILSSLSSLIVIFILIRTPILLLFLLLLPLLVLLIVIIIVISIILFSSLYSR